MNFQKGLIVVLAAFILLGGVLFVNRVLPGDAFSKEEAQHALYGLSIWKDIKTLDWSGFWYDTQRQMYWPFLHSWGQALFFFLFGVSFVSARLLSFVLFLATLILLYDVSVRFSEKSGWKIGVLACLLMLASPLTLKFAAMNTLETLGGFIFTAAFYLYTLSEERKLGVDYAVMALLFALAIFANYLYAYFMIAAFVVMTLGKLGPIALEVFRLSRKGEKSALHFFWWGYRKLIVITVLAVIVGIWFFASGFSRKIILLQQAIFRYSGGESMAGLLPNLIYYPRVIIEQFSFSPWLGALLLISLFLPFVAFRYRQTGKLYTFIWTVIILATLTVPTKAPQVIYTIAPFVFVVFAAAVFYRLDNGSRSMKIVVMILLVPALFSLPRIGQLYFPPRGESMVSVLQYFRQGVPPQSPIAVSANLQHLNAEGIAFYFWNWKAKIAVDTIIGEEDLFRAGKYFLSLEIDPGSRYQAEILDDSLYRWNAFLAEKVTRGEAREYSFRRFENLGLTAKIYEKRS